jgi:hypothetical protein
MDDPSWSLAPELALFQLTGRTQMQSVAPPFLRGVQTLDNFGAGNRDEQLGVRLSYGAGFSGFDLDYHRSDMHSTEIGRTTEDWGAIPAGTDVTSRILMEEIRLRYVAAIYDWADAETEGWFKAGVGLQLAHREIDFTARDVNSTNAQRIAIKDDVAPMLAVRLAAGRGPLDVTLDYAINDDWGFGTGDFDQRFYDLSVRASYFLEAQDLTLFGGYRRFDIPSRGNEQGLEYRTDFTFDGLFFGLRFIF